MIKCNDESCLYHNDNQCKKYEQEGVLNVDGEYGCQDYKRSEQSIFNSYFIEEILYENVETKILHNKSCYNNDYSLAKIVGGNRLIIDETLYGGINFNYRYTLYENGKYIKLSRKDKELNKSTCEWLRATNLCQTGILTSTQVKMIENGLNI